MIRFLLLVSLLLAVATPRSGASDYLTEVLPIMKTYCWDCHSNETEVKGNVALDPEVLFDQIGTYNIIRPGNAAESGFVERLKLDETHNDFMPRKGKALPKPEIEKIEAWIQSGAIVDAKKPTEEEAKRLAEMKSTAPDPAAGTSADPMFQLLLEPPYFLESWKNQEGRAIEAKLLGLEGNSAKLLLRNGKSYVVPLTSLDEESAAKARRLAAP
jgi:mono/diheme cytochrome c family protein